MSVGIRQFFLILLCALIVPYAALSAAEEKISLSFGVGPQQSPTELAQRWVPLMRYLSEKTGYAIQFATAKDIPTYQEQMRAGQYDLALVNPVIYAMLHASVGYEAFAKEEDGNVTGVLVVRQDSPYKSINDLNGLTAAFPAPSAIGATVLPLKFLSEANVQVMPKYVVSLDSVYRSVAKNLFPVGGGELHTFDAIEPQVRNQLRILWTAPALPPPTFAAHPRVAKEVISRVLKVMEDMDQSAQGRELLKAINFKGFIAAKDSDFDVMRKLKLKPPGDPSGKN
jgi:phosphonate transport system substrate-binding protein